jgi:hypothetical protein
MEPPPGVFYARGNPLPATVPRTLNALSRILKMRRLAKVTRVTIRARDRLKWCYTAFIWCVSRVGSKALNRRTI